MPTQIHSNKTGTALASLDGVAKDPIWGSGNPAIFTVAGITSPPADQFLATITPAPGGPFGVATLTFECSKLDGGALSSSIEIEIVEGPATHINNLSAVEN